MKLRSNGTETLLTVPPVRLVWSRDEYHVLPPDVCWAEGDSIGDVRGGYFRVAPHGLYCLN